jgi:hypothetical protein
MESNISAQELMSKILSSDFHQAIKMAGGKLYFVGGSIRDQYLGRKSKDIDMVVANISKDKLQKVLMPYGRLDAVGASFGVIKFRPRQLEPFLPMDKKGEGFLDIALPRTERPMTDAEKSGKKLSAYQSFITNHDNVSLEEDLFRRDFTINAMSHDYEGNLVDPYNGMQDIKDKKIRMVNPESFSDDPLRMLRGVQFASRFGFEIEPKTFEQIQKNCALIKGITGERILTELSKISGYVDKDGNHIGGGDQYLAAKLLDQTGLWKEITNLQCNLTGRESWFAKSRTIAEFLFLMLYGSTGLENTVKICQKLRCEVDTIKGVKALYEAWDSTHLPHAVVFKMHQILPQSLKFTVLPERILDSIHSDMPKSYKELQVGGDDMLKLGIKGENIKVMFNRMLNAIFTGQIENDREQLMNFAKS